MRASLEVMLERPCLLILPHRVVEQRKKLASRRDLSSGLEKLFGRDYSKPLADATSDLTLQNWNLFQKNDSGSTMGHAIVSEPSEQLDFSVTLGYNDRRFN
jgi:hypothetical protein